MSRKKFSGSKRRPTAACADLSDTRSGYAQRTVTLPERKRSGSMQVLRTLLCLLLAAAALSGRGCPVVSDRDSRLPPRHAPRVAPGCPAAAATSGLNRGRSRYDVSCGTTRFTVRRQRSPGRALRRHHGRQLLGRRSWATSTWAASHAAERRSPGAGPEPQPGRQGTGRRASLRRIRQGRDDLWPLRNRGARWPAASPAGPSRASACPTAPA